MLLELVDPTRGKTYDDLMAAAGVDRDGYWAALDYLYRNPRIVKYATDPITRRHVTVRVATDREKAEFRQILDWTLRVECLGPEPFDRRELVDGIRRGMNSRAGQFPAGNPPALPALFTNAVRLLPLTPSDRERLPDAYVQAVIQALIDRGLIHVVSPSGGRHCEPEFGLGPVLEPTPSQDAHCL